jgi:hypothetical protein
MTGNNKVRFFGLIRNRVEIRKELLMNSNKRKKRKRN